MKKPRLTISALFLFFTLIAVSAQNPPTDVTLTANPLFQKNCARCHGKSAEGHHHFGGPSLVSDKIASSSTDDLTKIINNGRGHMPKYSNKLTPQEIDDLVRQIKELNKK